MTCENVLVHRGARVTTLTLDRPKALNALTTSMVAAVKDCVETARQPVLICSAHPTAFCAGGDIRAIREHALGGDLDAIEAFFATEYAMNLAIAHASPPVVSIVDGICMGGGLGIAGHSDVHVVSERASISMPESAIGFFPDIGASHFLSAAPGGIGLYLGMTGARIGPDDAVYSGLATHVIAAESVSAFVTYTEESGVDDAVRALARPVDLGACELHINRADIDRCFSADSVEEILARVAATKNTWGADTFAMLRRAAPQSLAAAFTLIRQARGRTLAECLNADLDVALSMTRTADFLEGVGARLVDKNREPIWVSTVGDAAVATTGTCRWGMS